ncbi:MAG: hypothetical protein JRF45_13070 [Deltaproteobacteria bacterium]|jgi:hypothetical protein|nr:hypothetical protein [Deltaproteobacteria bacterium]MDX2498807.1 hypothetical protein [Desulfobacterales bacterium]MBW1827493.1 hypothetical protein [Deltaproteobacteria bacterium]MBW1970078.1 hypothetical protein [Deltaproteobacteria bacterium]MBW2157403.1 hypothetical protein [Deltaproteobacteria bacterium]
MKMLLETTSFSAETKRLLSQVCEKHHIKQVKELVDIYRHKPDLFFEVNGFSKKCWDEISGLLSDPSNPYMPEDSVISFQKALLIVKRNHLVDELAELSKEIQLIR